MRTRNKATAARFRLKSDFKFAMGKFPLNSLRLTCKPIWIRLNYWLS